MKTSQIRITATIHRHHARKTAKSTILFVAFIFITLYSFSQTAAYLDFKNPTLETGTAGADGAEYRFANVAANVDAIITIAGRSDALVNLLNADMNTSGFDGAFQPQVGYNNGTTPGAADWWMQFNVRFVTAGTTTPVSIEEFNVSGVDVDGNGQYINEYVSFFDMQDYSLEAGSGLSISSLYENINGTMLSGRRFDGPTGNYLNIDTAATAVMVTTRYVNKTSFTVRTGGRSTDVSGASDRMYSFYFQNFAYNTPNNFLLANNSSRIRPVRATVKTAVNVYPNPSYGVVNVQLPDVWNNEKVMYQVYDASGSVVSDGLHLAGNQMSLNHLKRGVYMLHLHAGHETTVHRVVKL